MGSYVRAGMNVCEGCGVGCQGCEGRPDKCTVCEASKVLQNSACLTKCTSFYFETSIMNIDSNSSMRICKSCNISCSKCLSFYVCLYCDSAYLVTTG